MQQSECPGPSPASGAGNLCSQLFSYCLTRRLDVLLEWGKVSFSSTVFPSNVSTEEKVAMLKPKTDTFQMGAEYGQHLVEMFRRVLDRLG